MQNCKTDRFSALLCVFVYNYLAISLQLDFLNGICEFSIKNKANIDNFPTEFFEHMYFKYTNNYI